MHPLQLCLEEVPEQSSIGSKKRICLHMLGSNEAPPHEDEFQERQLSWLAKPFPAKGKHHSSSQSRTLVRVAELLRAMCLPKFYALHPGFDSIQTRRLSPSWKRWLSDASQHINFASRALSKLPTSFTEVRASNPRDAACDAACDACAKQLDSWVTMVTIQHWKTGDYGDYGDLKTNLSNQHVRSPSTRMRQEKCGWLRKHTKHNGMFFNERHCKCCTVVLPMRNRDVLEEKKSQP